LPLSTRSNRCPSLAKRPLRHRLTVVSLAIAAGCQGLGRDGGARQVVEVALPEPHERYGPRAEAPVSVVEFGSHSCSLCRRFAIEQFPVLDSLFFQSGRARYRYVDVPPDPDAAILGGVVECLSGAVGGFVPARLMVYSRPGSDSDALIEAVAGRLGMDGRVLRACADSVASSPRASKERLAARALEVPGTPTFLVGEVTSDGRLVGWPTVGLAPLDTLRRQIEEAEALVLVLRARDP